MTGSFDRMTTTGRPLPTAGWRAAAGAGAVLIVLALVAWVPLVNELLAPCGGGIGTESCREPIAALRWGQFAAGIAAGVLGVATAVGLALFAGRGVWLRRARMAGAAFVAAAGVWLVLYLVSLPSLL